MWKNAIITRKWVGLKSHNFSRIMFYYNIVKIKSKFKWLNFWSMSPRGRMDQKLFLQSTQLFYRYRSNSTEMVKHALELR